MPDDVKDAASSTAVQDKDADSESSTEKEGEKESESPPEAEDTEGLKPKTAERIQQLLADRREAQEALADLQARIEELEAERKKGEPKTEEQVKTEAMRREARGKLEEIYPELREIREEREVARKEAESERATRDHEAMAETIKLAREAGIPASDAEGVSKVLAGIIAADPSLLREFRRGSPKAAVRQAFEEAEAFLGKIGNRKKNAQTEKDKEKLRTLPKTHTPGGSAGEGKDKTEPVKSIADADKRVREILGRMKKE